MKAKSLTHDQIVELANFYDVTTYEQLIAEQAEHIEKLQAKLLKLQPAVPLYVGSPRKG